MLTDGKRWAEGGKRRLREEMGGLGIVKGGLREGKMS